MGWTLFLPDDLLRENSNFWRESLLEVIRQNIAWWCQQTFCFEKYLNFHRRWRGWDDPGYLLKSFLLYQFIWISKSYWRGRPKPSWGQIIQSGPNKNNDKEQESKLIYRSLILTLLNIINDKPLRQNSTIMNTSLSLLNLTFIAHNLVL